MYLYNSATRKKAEFVTHKAGHVEMYTCGPTVYHFAHIGNLRSYIMEDVLEKALRYEGYNVTRVMNITDVGHLASDADTGEDKMLKGAKRENKSVMDIARFYTDAFFADCAKLNIKTPDVVEPATNCIEEFITMVSGLIDKGYAYVAGGNVYFDTSKLGEQTVTLDYKHFRTVFNVNVVMGDAPVISGAAEDKTYCIEQEVTVSDANGDLESVTLDGVAVTLVDGKFTVTGKEGQQTIVATDKAGNVTTIKITVNAAHTGGTATCCDKAKCDVCGEAYGEKNADKHTKEAKWTITADKHSKAYECCGKVVVAEEAHEWKDGKCEECGYEAAPGTEQKPIEIPADKETVKEEAKVEAGDEQHYELDEKMAGMILDDKIKKLQARLDARKVTLVIEPEAYRKLLSEGFSPEYGAREIERVLNSRLTPMLMKEILFGEHKQGFKAIISATETGYDIRTE